MPPAAAPAAVTVSLRVLRFIFLTHFCGRAALGRYTGDRRPRVPAGDCKPLF